MAERIVHCWEAGPEDEDGCSTTCMLPDNHVGPHLWARDDEDDEMLVTFTPYRDDA